MNAFILPSAKLFQLRHSTEEFCNHLCIPRLLIFYALDVLPMAIGSFVQLRKIIVNPKELTIILSYNIINTSIKEIDLHIQGITL